VGRERALGEIRQALLSQRRQAVTGISGVGKTQLVVEYAYRFRAEYSGVFWCHAASGDALNTSFRQLAELLSVVVAEESGWKEALRHKLEDATAPWLLIVDAVETPALLRNFLPRTGPGHVLLTSLDHGLDTLGIYHPFLLDEFEGDEATQFLLSRTGRQNTEGAELLAASTLAQQELGGLPLAVEQAGAFISSARLPFEHYLSEYRSRRFNLLERGAPAHDRPSLLPTLAKTLERLADQHTTLDLAQLIAYLDEDSLPRRFVTTAAAQYALANGRASHDSLAIDEGLAPLFSYALIRETSSRLEYRMHNLVRLALRELTPPEKRQGYEEIAVRTASLEVDDLELFPAAYPPLQSRFGRAAARMALDRKMTSLDAGRLFRKVGARLLNSEDADIGKAMLDASVAIIRDAQGPSSPELVPALLALAGFDSYFEGPAAKDLYEQVIAIADPETQAGFKSIAQNNLAELFRKARRFEEAERFLKDALQTRQRLFGKEHRSIATTLNNLGNLHGGMGQFATALEFYRESYRMRQQLLQPPHPHLANSLNNLGWVYIRLRWPKAAEPALQSALEMWQAIYGASHPEVAITLNNLADLYEQIKRMPLARQYRQRAYDVKRNL
jgi:tetratricopeptide (TPR) repeat protein